MDAAGFLIIFYFSIIFIEMATHAEMIVALEPFINGLVYQEIPPYGYKVGIIEKEWFTKFLNYIREDNGKNPGPVPTLDLANADKWKIHEDIEVVDMNVTEILQDLCGGVIIEKRQLVQNPKTLEPEVLFTPVRLDIIFKSSRKGVTVSPIWTVEMAKIYFCKSIGANPKQYTVNNANNYKEIDENMLIKRLLEKKVFTLHVITRSEKNKKSKSQQLNCSDSSTKSDSNVFAATLVALANIDQMKDTFMCLESNPDVAFCNVFQQYLGDGIEKESITAQITQEFANNHQEFNAFKADQFVSIYQELMKDIVNSFPGSQEVPKLDITKSWEDNWNTYLNFKPSPVFSKFYGLMQNVQICEKCGEPMGKMIPFSIIQLPIAKKIFRRTTLLSCIKKYMKNTKGEKKKCPSCQSKYLGDQLQIMKLPEVLVFHLDRFKSDSKGMIKDLTNVYYDFVLDMSQFCRSDERYKTYDLKAIIIHPGGSPATRHRVIAHDSQTEKWISYSKECNNVVSHSNAINYQNVHTLFFEKHIGK